jgi:hypothetical protein
MRQTFEEKKKRLIVFLKNNPKTTYKKYERRLKYIQKEYSKV